MISNEKKAQIIRLYTVEKWRINTIARELYVHHSVVKRVLAEQGSQVHKTQRRPSKLDPYLPFVLATLERYPSLTAARLYQMVRERGYDGGASQFRLLVSRHRPRPPCEAYLRLRTLPGEQAQVDWAHFGKPPGVPGGRSLSAFVMVLSFSRMLFVRFFFGQTQGLFLQGHQGAFTFFGGVPRVLLYDNLKSAVLERIGDAIRFHPHLWDFATAYGFEPRPVAVCRGNEKGRVERAIRYLRSAFFAARPFTTLDALNQQALQFCLSEAASRKCPQDKTCTVQEAFEQEQRALLPLPQVPYPTPERLEVKVGKTPYVRFDRNDYSVPYTLCRKLLVVLATAEQVRILDGETEVACHGRSWATEALVEDPAHIQQLVERKRRAHSSRSRTALEQAVPQVKGLLAHLAQRGLPLGARVQRLARLLSLYGATELGRALDQVMHGAAPDVHAIQLWLDQQSQMQHKAPPITTGLPADSPLCSLNVTPHPLSSYDTLAKEDDDDSR